jgi:hypothetical protein
LHTPLILQCLLQDVLELVVLSPKLRCILLELEGMPIEGCVAIQESILLLDSMVQLVLPKGHLLAGPFSDSLRNANKGILVCKLCLQEVA